MNATDIQFKLKDVFNFRYFDRGASNHCFDGQLIVKKGENGGFILMDTYWSSKHDGFERWGDYSRCFSPEDALKRGELTFVCNLDEVEEIREGDCAYYADEDVFNLSYQHGCYKYFVKRKGAERSQAKMIETAKDKIKEAEYTLASTLRTLERLRETLAKIEAGDTTQYIF
jgi:hypothetical protein